MGNFTIWERMRYQHNGCRPHSERICVSFQICKWQHTMCLVQSSPINNKMLLTSHLRRLSLTIMVTSLSTLKAQYETDGYVLVDNLVQESDWPELEKACDRVIERTRNGSWSHRRTVGKQFPPYGDENPDSWGIQHLMHPELGEPVFAKWYTSSKLLSVVNQLLQCEDQDLQLGMNFWSGVRHILNI